MFEKAIKDGQIVEEEVKKNGLSWTFVRRSYWEKTGKKTIVKVNYLIGCIYVVDFNLITILDNCDEIKTILLGLVYVF